MKQKESEILKELCVAEGKEVSVGTFKLLSGRRMPIRRGPIVPLPAGTLIELSAQTSKELFAMGCIIPVDPAIPPVGKYKILRRQKLVIDGLYTDLQAGEFIELTDTEALPYLRAQQIELVQEVTK